MLNALPTSILIHCCCPSRLLVFLAAAEGVEERRAPDVLEAIHAAPGKRAGCAEVSAPTKPTPGQLHRQERSVNPPDVGLASEKSRRSHARWGVAGSELTNKPCACHLSIAGRGFEPRVVGVGDHDAAPGTGTSTVLRRRGVLGPALTMSPTRRRGALPGSRQRLVPPKLARARTRSCCGEPKTIGDAGEGALRRMRSEALDGLLAMARYCMTV